MMDRPDSTLQYLIDRLTQSRFSFALYRLPGKDLCQFILQPDENPRISIAPEEGAGQKEGFIIAPFRTSETHPAVLIRPDITAAGWDEIEAAIPKDFPLLTQYSSHLFSRNREEESAAYGKAFGRFMEPLRSGDFRKLVLSRKSILDLPEGFSPMQTFCNACAAYPEMFVYLCHTPVTGTWMGSTPEILLKGSGDRWDTVALAGTQTAPPDSRPAEWDAKNREEQEFVSRYIRDILRTFGSEITEKGPFTSRAGHLIHLKTCFSFRMKKGIHAEELICALHPTPAVCGLPKEKAVSFIPENEGYDRKYYSGYIGRITPEGPTDLYVNLRCMELYPEQAVLYAGGGILPSSACPSEWEETLQKMNTMKQLLS